MSHARETVFTSFHDQAPEIGVNHIIASVPTVLLEPVVPDLSLASVGRICNGPTYILHQQATVKGLAWLFAPKQRFSYCTCCSIPPNNIVGGESLPFFGISFFCFDVDSRYVCVLTDIDDSVVEFDRYEAIGLLHAVSIHYSNDLVERQNCHTAGMVFDPRTSRSR